MTRFFVRAVLPLTVAIVALAGLAPQARADVRLASPTSVDTAGQCLITPCRLDRALAVAQTGDEVTLEDGVPYTVNYQARATNAITIRPATPTAKPRLVGAANLVHPTLELAGGGTVRGLRIESSSAKGALKLARGARGFGLEVFAGATNGEVAVWMVSAPAGTALVNTVATTASAESAVEAIDDTVNYGPAGSVSIVNVTAIATGGSSWGITTGLGVANPVVKNSIVRSTAKSIHGRSSTMAVQVSNTNFPSTGAANFTEGGGNQKDVAVTFEAGTNNYRVPAGQPTIDAGAPDALTTGSFDPDGHARIVNGTQDIGAYEYDPTPPAGGGGGTDPGAGDTTTTPPTTTPTSTETDTTTVTLPDGTTYEVRADGTPILPEAAKPVLGQTVTVGAAAGRPLVRLPGSRRFVALAADASIPVGSTVDVTTSRIRLTSVRDGQGRTQTGEFWGGQFVVRQAKGKTPYTDLVLTGKSFAGCPKGRPKARRASVTAFAAKASKKKKAVVRSLWGRDDKGHFRTRGRNSVATVRGTVWLVQDRCDGTLTRVTKGAVDVREKGGRVVRLRAGRSHLARRR